MTESRIESCWRNVGSELAAQIGALWQAENAIGDSAEIARRSGEAVCVARSASDDRLLGVATAQPRQIPFLGQPMYYVRAFVAASARRGLLAHRLLHATQATLAADAAGPAPASAAIGIFLELENPVFTRDGERAVWRRSGFIYAGRTPNGLQRRIWYFPDARLRG